MSKGVDGKVHDKENGVGAPAIPPNEDEKTTGDGTGQYASGGQAGVKDKYANLAEEPKIYTESRVKAKEFKFPGGPSWGGLPRNAVSHTTGRPLLVPVPTSDIQGRGGKVTKRQQQYLHVLAATRLRALNEKWLRDNPGKPELKLCSGWRDNRWKVNGKPNLAKFHAHCRSKNRWLGPEYGPGEASVKTLGREGKQSCSAWEAFVSPHETGLAMDFGNNGLTASSARNKEMKESYLFKWLQQNAHLFGITPYIKEAWHWEVKVPADAWVTGEEFVTGDNYAVRIKGVGKQGKYDPNALGTGAGGSSTGCSATTTLGSKEQEKPFPDLTLLAVQESEVGKAANQGAKFPNLKKRDLSTVVNLVIHDTAGFWGRNPGPEGVQGGTSPRCIGTLVSKGASIHFSIDFNGDTRQHAQLDEVCRHIGGGINGKSVAMEFINPIAMDLKTAKRELKKKPNLPIIHKGKIWAGGKKYYVANTARACEALYKLIVEVTKKIPSLPHKYPCTEGSLKKHTDSRHKEAGIFAHRRQTSTRTDGVFAEFYCARRLATGEAPLACWFSTMAAFIERSKNGDSASDWKSTPKDYNRADAKSYVQAHLEEVKKEILGDEEPKKEDEKAKEDKEKESSTPDSKEDDAPTTGGSSSRNIPQ